MSAMLDADVPRARVREIYDRTAAFYNRITAEGMAKPRAAGLSLLDPRPGERFLEVGVGTGRVLSEVLHRGATCAGVDLSPGMLDVARDALDEDCRSAFLALADACLLPFVAGSFDCLFSSYTLDLLSLAQVPDALAEMLRVLRPGGRVAIVNLTEGEGADAAFSDDWKRRYAADPEAVSCSRPVLLQPFVEAAGATEVRRTYVGGPDSWPSEVITALRA